MSALSKRLTERISKLEVELTPEDDYKLFRIRVVNARKGAVNEPLGDIQRIVIGDMAGGQELLRAADEKEDVFIERALAEGRKAKSQGFLVLWGYDKSYKNVAARAANAPTNAGE